MATPPRRGPIKRRSSGKLPKLTKKGKLLSNKELEDNINNWIDDELTEELRMTAFLDVNTRRQIRLATGVGDMEAFVNEFNNGFANSSQLSSDGNAKSKPGEQAFGEAWSDRPKLRKISREFRITYKPKSGK